MIATGCTDRKIRIWQVDHDQSAISYDIAPLHVNFSGHRNIVTSVSFSPDRKSIATISWDNTARLWRIESLDEMLVQGCNWLHDYLQNNADESEKHLCDDITPRKDEISPRKK